MHLRDRAGNFCHRAIDLVELVTILSFYVNTNVLNCDTFDYHDFRTFFCMWNERQNRDEQFPY